ncbi:PQQ-binding-like beta-propeller repeat protein [Nocardiopsis potens]|uniref:PQQ-binding-like beta-propeller repeat protein n=1 Tax=Nocardiopsis potens TaxID=1246458 RepID=UPI0003487B92|nr:PQQ-binding-like beta-propeller repeat protein [Nocardiopsis potens]
MNPPDERDRRAPARRRARPLRPAARAAARRAPAAAAAGAALLLLAACGGPGDPADAEPRDDPPAPAPEVPADRVPPTLAAEPAWAAPFSAPPKASGDGFVGPVMPEESGGDLLFLGVGPDGATRWSLSRNPSCTAFAATRDADGGDLVVVLDSDADPERALLASTTTAAAYRPDDGALAWGPVEVPGTLVGPGLVFGAPTKSIMSTDTGPKTALDPSTGAVAADEEDGGPAVLHEHQGALLTEEDGELRAVDTGTGEELWSTRGLEPPEHAPGTSPAPGPRPETDAGAATVLEWRADGAEPAAYTVHDLRTGKLLAELGGGAEPRLIGTPEGPAAVTGADPGGGTGGDTVLIGLDAGSEDPRELWRRDRPDDTPRTEAITGGVLYLSDGSTTRAVDMRTGDDLGKGPWPAPVAAAPDGTALLPVPSDGPGDAFAALPAAP